MTIEQSEIIEAKIYYRNKAPGWVALINGSPYHFWGANGKSDAQAMVEKANRSAGLNREVESAMEIQGNVPNSTQKVPPATKLVEVRLSALTRVEYMEVVEVPANITQAELDDLVNARYSQVDGGEFTSDPEYWERGTCEAVDSDMPDATPTMMAFRTEHGLRLERADAAAQEQPTCRKSLLGE